MENISASSEKKTKSILVTVNIGVFLASIDGSIINIALPTIQRCFNASFSSVQWAVISYLITITVLILPLGRIGDIIGKRYLYFSGFMTFTIGSLCCGLSPSIEFLICARVIQGLGAAMIMAVGLAIIAEVFSPKDRGSAMGIISSVAAAAIALGPTVGGFLIQIHSWNLIFFINIPIGVCGSYLAYKSIPETKANTREPFDYFASVIVFVGLLSFMIAFTDLQNTDAFNPLILSLFFIFLVSIIVLIIIEKKKRYPLIDLRLFKNSSFSFNLCISILVYATYSGMLILLPFFFESVLHYSVKDTGLLITVIPIMLGILSLLSGRLSDRFGATPLILAGLIFLSIAVYSMSSFRADTDTYFCVLRLLLFGIGIGLFMPPNLSAVMMDIPKERLGIASGIVTLSRTIGHALGVAILGTIWILRKSHYANLDSVDIGPYSESLEVLAFRDTVYFAVVFISIALILGLFLLKERSNRLRS